MTHRPTRVHAAGPAYAAVLAAIHAAAFPDEPWGAGAFQVQLEMHGVIGLLDERGGLLMMRVTLDEAEILTIGVLPSLRRRGIARSLLWAAIAKAHGLGARSMFLEVETSNQAARSLYAKAGFAEVGHRRRYYANGADALILRLDLPPLQSPEMGQAWS